MAQLGQVNELAQVRIVTYLGSQSAINVLHFRVSAVVTGGITTLEAATALDPTWDDEYKNCIPDDVTYRGTGVRKITAIPLPLEDVFVGNEAPGNLNDIPLPGQVATVIAWKTALVGRSFRGRTYIPWAGQGANDPPGVPSAAHRALVAALGVAILGPHVIVGATGTVTLKLCVRSIPLTVNTDVTQGLVRTVWGTQRRRGGFGATNPPPF